MDTQTPNKLFIRHCMLECVPSLNLICSNQPCATSLDYGFDFDQQELGQELASTCPPCVSGQPAGSIGAEEFDALYKWFIS